MKPLNDFIHKQSKYMPTFAKATGKPTVYIPGYPYEDEGTYARNRIPRGTEQQLV